MPNSQYKVLLDTAHTMQYQAAVRGYDRTAKELTRQAAALSELVNHHGEGSELAQLRAEYLRHAVRKAADILAPF